MHKRALQLALVVACLVTIVTACGGSKTSAKPTTVAPNTIASQPAFKATLTADSHHPVVKKNWFITVTVNDLSGKPIPATLHMQVLAGGLPVGQVDAKKNGKGKGKVFHFVGRHHENITWPQFTPVGYPLTLEAIITAKGKTERLHWPLSVVPR